MFGSLQYGLVAEEVAEVASELVVYDDEGQPYSVRYEVLGPLLVNEVKRQRHEMEEQRRTIETLAARVLDLEDEPVRGASP